MNAGQYLREHREARALSLSDVYKATGITDSRLNRIENSIIENPSPSVLGQLADLYSIDVIDLFIRYGYLSEDYKQTKNPVFKNVYKLSPDEIRHVQNEINFILSKKSEDYL